MNMNMGMNKVMDMKMYTKITEASEQNQALGIFSSFDKFGIIINVQGIVLKELKVSSAQCTDLIHFLQQLSKGESS
jgi:hypothetical protein